METFLNLAWLALTLAALWIWRFRWAASRRNARRNVRQETIAIVCVLALLFPVISLTDDLHPDIVPADTVSSKRMHCLLVAHAAKGANTKSASVVHSSFALLSLSFADASLHLANLPPGVRHTHAASVRLTGFGRSPPSLS